MPAQQLNHLISGLEIIDMVGPVDIPITGIAYHSKTVRPGYLFVALKGAGQDGHAFIPEAVKAGAAAVLGEDTAPAAFPATFIRVRRSRPALAQVAARFFANPSKSIPVVGITGTNGKTTTTYIIESILNQAGFRPGIIGTINYRFAQTVLKSSHTTPESLDLQQLLATMVEEDVSHVVMEVSSHALDQDRVEGIDFDIAVFTNLTQDHLDYHKTIERYSKSKAKLFSQFLTRGEAGRQKVAVINSDDPFGLRLVELTAANVIRYGLEGSRDITVERIVLSRDGIAGRLKTAAGDIDFRTRLLGRFNLYNIMAATGVTLSLGIAPEAIESGLACLAAVPGRLEPVETGTDVTILVDYAHTPDALEKTLASVRPLAPARVLTVFGCGGNRDRGKRPLMGRIAALMSDVVIVTSDNPRCEEPQEIVNEILPGIQEAGVSRIEAGAAVEEKGYVVVLDRRNALELALSLARKGDTVVVAGKGHEDYQIIGTEVRHFDDREVLRELLASRIKETV
nr:UDP-N-acetylmuramoyl-L-alanyl-D-glutamate--2,6-diaminopimelate ligase [Deltaproteobacteria bacterium]